MTALDDALNSSSISLDAPKLTAAWAEIPASETPALNPDTLNDLSGQMTGEYVVTQSLEDALPDPVTMTSGNDASGTLSAALVGREGLTAETWGWRTGGGVLTGGGTSSLVGVDHPPNIQHGDYELVAISTTAGATMDETGQDPAVAYRWKLLGSSFDGVAMRTWIWGRHYYANSPSMPFTLNNPSAVNFVGVSVAIYARAADGSPVPFRVASVVSGAPGASTASHATPAMSARRGVALGVWAGTSAMGDWTATGAGTEIQEINYPTFLRSMISGQVMNSYADQSITMTATTAVAGTDATYIGVELEIADRAPMDARKLFSPFNKNSPFYGFARDTAGLSLDQSVITESGPVATRLYTGQMSDMPLQGSVVGVTGISKARLDMDMSLTLPIVKGDRENNSIDWFVTWLMARGGEFAGPSIAPTCIYWNTFYGSVHAHLDSLYCYSRVLIFPNTGGNRGVKYPTQITGPFVSGMYAEQKALQTLRIDMNLDNLYLARYNTNLPKPSGLLFQDQMSLASSSGRITFWVRGDPIDDNTAYMGGGGDPILFQITTYNSANVYQADLQVGVLLSRKLYASMQSTIGPYSQNELYNTTTIPTDGEWHFVGIAWNWDAGTIKYKMDAVEGTSSLFSATPTAALTSTDDSLRATGGSARIVNSFRSSMPVADLQIEAGPTAYTDSWTRHYPAPTGLNATYRPTYQRMESIAEEAPVQSWDTLAELARASLSAYRIDELDNYAFMPPSFFGELDQLTPAAVVVDTDVNAGELDVKTDATKIRNVVTIEFQETKAASVYTTVYALTSATEIPKGTTSITFALDLPLAEIHLAPFLNQPLTLLTAAQITTPSTIPTNIHYYSANTLSDGSGVVQTSITTTAIISSFTTSSVTITFTNNYSASLWMVNNGTDVPFMRILGYPVKIATGYVTARDSYSVALRRERPLSIQMPWIHDRDTALQIAQVLATQLSQPRGELSLKVMGDPRRKPGQLVTVKDSEGTQAAGNWRILSVVHNANGPEFTQDLKLVSVPNTMLWDGVDGWDIGAWGE